MQDSNSDLSAQSSQAEEDVDVEERGKSSALVHPPNLVIAKKAGSKKIFRWETIFETPYTTLRKKKIVESSVKPSTGSSSYNQVHKHKSYKLYPQAL